MSDNTSNLVAIEEFAAGLVPEGYELLAWAPLDDPDHPGEQREFWAGFTDPARPDDPGVYEDTTVPADELPEDVRKALKGILVFESLERVYSELLREAGDGNVWPEGYRVDEDGQLQVVLKRLKQGQADEFWDIPYEDVLQRLIYEADDSCCNCCPYCGGSGGGSEPELACPHCRGTGFMSHACDPVPFEDDWMSIALKQIDY